MSDEEQLPAFLDKIEHQKKRAHLLAYSETFNLLEAARLVPMSRTNHYMWLESDPDYAAAFKEAGKVGADALEAALIRRAKTGVRRYKFHQGKPIWVDCSKEHPDAVNLGTDEEPHWCYHYYENDFSDTVGMFLLKGAKPEKYRERYEVKNVDEEELDREIDRELAILVDREKATLSGENSPENNGH